MANLTLAIDGDVLRRARVRAVTEGTSVNAVVRDFVGDYAAGAAERRQWLAELTELADEIGFSSGAEGRTWTREDLHDRAALR